MSLVDVRSAEPPHTEPEKDDQEHDFEHGNHVEAPSPEQDHGTRVRRDMEATETHSSAAGPFTLVPMGGRPDPATMDHVSCTFCQIIAGKSPSLTFYADEQTVAIMDLRQPGWPQVAHVLVLPREHVETLDSLSGRSAAALMDTTVKVAKAVRQVVRPDGYSLWQSNGEVAGQEVPHVHVHLLTRSGGDGLLRVYETAPEQPSLETMAPVADRLRHELDLS